MLDYFKCEGQGNCIPEEWVCDDVKHCSDGSDENITNPICRKLLKERSQMRQDSTLCVSPFIECYHIRHKTKKICAQTCDEIEECVGGYDESRYGFNCSLGVQFKYMTATEEKQFIQSPNYPNHYFNEARIAWIISLEEGYQLRLKMEDFKTEYIYDSLWVIKGEVKKAEIKVQV